jgi:hypothetical protein
MSPTLPRFPGWWRERPSAHQCSPWCVPPVHAWRVTMARGASLSAFRAWLATLPVRILACRYAEAAPCAWICGVRLSPACGLPGCCGEDGRQPLMVLGEDGGWNAMDADRLAGPPPVHVPPESRAHG